MANLEIGEHVDGHRGGPRSQTFIIVGTRDGQGEAGESSDWQPRSVLTSNLEPRTKSRLAPTTSALVRAEERRRLARDLHDGVQNELFSLMLRLKLAEEDRTTPSTRNRPRDLPASARQAWPRRSTPRASGARTGQREHRRNHAPQHP